MEIEIGKIIREKYQVTKEIARSNVKSLWYGKRLEDNLPVIIKENSDSQIHLQYQKIAQEEFERRSSYFKELSHPNIASLLEYFFIVNKAFLETRYYVIQRYYEGTSLLDSFSNRKVTPSPEIILPYILDLCNLLEYLHSHTPPILLYNLAPENIVITYSGELKVINLGLTRMLRPGSFRNNLFMGVPGYSAPEQYGLEEPTPAADIFGLGAIFYFLLTLQDPRENPFKFAPVRSFNPLVSIQLARAISKCLQMEARDRFASAKELKEHLQNIPLLDISSTHRVEAIKVTKEEPPTALPALKKPTIKVNLKEPLLNLIDSIRWSIEKYISIKVLLNYIILILIVLVVASGIIKLLVGKEKFKDMIFISSGSSSSKITVLDVSTLESIEINSGECKAMLTVSPKLDYIYAINKGIRIIVINTKNLKVEKTFPLDSVAQALAISDDGKWLFTANIKDNTISKIKILGGEVTSTVKVGESPVNIIFITLPTKKFLAVANFSSNNITLINPETNTYNSDIKVGKGPKALVNKDNILYAGNWQDNTISVIDMEIGNKLLDLPVGVHPNSLTCWKEKNYLYVANQDSNSITILDTSSYKVISEIKLPYSPIHLALHPPKNLLLVGAINQKESKNVILFFNINTNELIKEKELPYIPLYILPVMR